MLDKTRPMNLGDIFNTTINLIKETFLRNLIIAAAFFVPAGIVISFGFDYFFSIIFKIVENSVQEGASAAYNPDYGDIFSGLFIYGIVITLIVFCTLVVMIGVTFIGKMQLNGQRISVNKTFQKIFSITFFRAIGQGLLLGLMFSIIFGIPIVLLILSGVLDIPVFAIFGIFFLFGAFFVCTFFYIRWYFAFTSIVCDDQRVINSFRKSCSLVDNYWWRTFGLIILISITVQFAISIVTTPVSFILMWDFISEYFKLIAQGELVKNDPSQLFSAMGSFGYALGVMITISSILQYTIAPLFNVTLYYDLKIRKNDFNDETDTLSKAPSLV